MCHCNSDRPEFGGSLISVTLTRARKPHVCLECGSPIEPGTQYYPFRSGPTYDLVDGNMRRTTKTGHMCQSCYQAWRDLLDHIDESVICLGQLFRCIDEHLEDGDLDASAFCILWRQRFAQIPADSWEAQYEEGIERGMLTSLGMPNQQLPLGI